MEPKELIEKMTTDYEEQIESLLHEYAERTGLKPWRLELRRPINDAGEIEYSITIRSNH